MKIWHQYPFVRLVFPFIAGIGSAIYFNFPVKNSLLPFILILLLIYAIIVFIIARKIKYSLRWLHGFFINLLLILTGYEITLNTTPFINKQNISHVAVSNTSLMIRLTEPVIERPNSYKIIARTVMFSDSSLWKTVTGKAILYFEKDSSVRSLKYGDILIVQTSLNPIRPPMNPGEFNYKRYLSNRGIYDQGFVKKGDWSIIATERGNPVFSIAYRVRANFLHILESRNIKGDEFAVVSALLLGCTDYLDAEQMKVYSGSGAMHILSVSGLHVGIIYFFLNLILFFLNKNKRSRILKVLLLLLLIWIYALITGFSPSVLRAATMFSFIIVGELMTRRINIYNAIAASALVLLSIQPYLITDVGFQLSYLAVIGIVWLYRPISTLILPSAKTLRLIWQTCAVSIAATIVTFPLTIYYFRQFPNLFLLTNLIAVPLSTLIIYTGIFVFATSPFPAISSLMATLMAKMTWLLNASITFIEGLPIAVTRSIHITLTEAILLFLVILSLSSFLFTRRNRFLYFSLITAILFIGSSTMRRMSNLNQKRIVVYSIDKSTAVDFIGGNKDVLLVDSALLMNKKKISFHIVNNRIISGIRSHEQVILTDQNFRNDHLIKAGPYIQFYQKTIAVIQPDIQLPELRNKFNIDFMILSHNADFTIHELSEVFNFDQIIIDNSNTVWRTNQWIKECNEAGIRYYSIRNNGAWAVDI